MYSKLIRKLNPTKLFFYLLTLSALLVTLPAKAYAGPGVGIGILIVFLTVIIAFIGSLLISIINFFKWIKNKLIKKDKNKK